MGKIYTAFRTLQLHNGGQNSLSHQNGKLPNTGTPDIDLQTN